MKQMPSPHLPKQESLSPSILSFVTLGYVTAFFCAWTGAWMVERALEPALPFLRTSGGQFTYWTLMKALLWVLPSLVLIRLSGRTLLEVLGGDWRSILLWGGGVGLLIGATGILQRQLAGGPLLNVGVSWPLLFVIVVAPVVEELTFRGAVLGNLQRRSGFAAANTLTAFLFMASHLPGWYFMGTLTENLTRVAGGAPSIFLLGWVFGYVNMKTNSTTTAILAHGLNNFFS